MNKLRPVLFPTFRLGDRAQAGFVVRVFLVTVALSALGAATLSCSNTQDGVGQYIDELNPVLADITHSIEQLDALFRREARLDPRNITPSDALEIVEEQFEMVKRGFDQAGDAVRKMNGITPPENCENYHIRILESLQLTEQGLGEFRSFYSLALSTGEADSSRRLKGNELLAEAQRAKQRGIFEEADCLGTSP
jgi:hypothetical protein